MNIILKMMKITKQEDKLKNNKLLSGITWMKNLMFFLKFVFLLLYFEIIVKSIHKSFITIAKYLITIPTFCAELVMIQ